MTTISRSTDNCLCSASSANLLSDVREAKEVLEIIFIAAYWPVVECRATLTRPIQYLRQTKLSEDEW